MVYVSEMSLLNEAMKIAPTILLLGFFLFMSRSAVQSMGGMGGGMMGVSRRRRRRACCARPEAPGAFAFFFAARACGVRGLRDETDET